MQITTLIENLVYRKGLVAEHGLSFYIENSNKMILFDTGQSKNFALNALKMGIDLTAVDTLIISHGHYDHIGGLPYFLEINKKAKIILKQDALLPKYKDSFNIGINQQIHIPDERLEFISQITEIAEGIFIIPQIKEYYDLDSHKGGFYTLQNDDKKEDTFSDELFLCIINKRKLNIISSCSHNGITNITETAVQLFQQPVNMITGGFHIKNSTESELEHIVNYFNENNIENIGICHCTGIENYPVLKTRCKANVFYNSTGESITLG